MQPEGSTNNQKRPRHLRVKFSAYLKISININASHFEIFDYFHIWSLVNFQAD